MAKGTWMQKIKEIKVVWLYLVVFLGLPTSYSIVAFGQDAAWLAVKDSSNKTISDSLNCVRTEFEQKRHEDMVNISELLMAIPAVEKKAQEMKEERRASSAILEAINNRN